MATGFDIFHKAVKTPPYPREILRIPLLYTFAVGSDMPAHKRLELQKIFRSAGQRPPRFLQ